MEEKKKILYAKLNDSGKIKSITLTQIRIRAHVATQYEFQLTFDLIDRIIVVVDKATVCPIDWISIFVFVFLFGLSPISVDVHRCPKMV